MRPLTNKLVARDAINDDVTESRRRRRRGAGDHVVVIPHAEEAVVADAPLGVPLSGQVSSDDFEQLRTGDEVGGVQALNQE